MPAETSIVLLNWNQAGLLAECLDSLGRVGGPPFSIVVVDNASTENADLEALSDRGRRFCLLRNPTNLGFAGGNNRGIRHALESGARQVLLLNTDTTVEPDFLEILIEQTMPIAGAGAIGPTIRFHSDPDRIWYEGAQVDRADGRPVHMPFGRISREAPEGPPRRTGFVSGCCFMVGADAWQRVGLLSDDFFFRWEDTDWCERARKAGLEHLYVPRALVYHKTAFRARAARAPAIGIYFETRNRLLWVRRHVEPRHKPHFYARALRASARLLVDLASEPAGSRALKARALFAGIVHFLVGRYGAGPAFLDPGA